MKRTFLLTLLALGALAGVNAAESGFTLGVPGAAKIQQTTAASANAWLSSNTAYPAMSIVAPGASAISVRSDAALERVKLASSEAGFALERTKPEYYLGDRIDEPNDVDWGATYEKYLADGTTGVLFDVSGKSVYVTSGGTVRFNWVLADGSVTEMTYVTSASCSGRPRRIYWTDHPYNAPSIDLSGKFVKFFGSSELLGLKYGSYTNSAAGVEQVITNRIVSGIYLDPSSKMLYAYGELQGQVVMAYYDTGTYERLLHVQAVEVCRPQVNVLAGEIGHALKPDGRGYDTTGLRARPTIITPTDNRGEYIYQHKGLYSYSPKNGEVYPLRPTKDCRWNAEVYWMETDEMEVQWPFELDHYECDWPKDCTVFVRGNISGDKGRSVFVPSDYTATLMDYQDPEGHARAVDTDNVFVTTGEGYSLLRLTTQDDIWFIPVHSVLRNNGDYFTLAAEEIAVGKEMQLRGGSISGTTDAFTPVCDANSPGYIYKAASDPVWNPNLYTEPQVQSDGISTNAIDSIASDGDTNTYSSVVYAVTAKTKGSTAQPKVEVWWNTTIKEADMPAPVTIPTLPQVYTVRWPNSGENPEIVIASQKGSAGESIYSHNAALYLADTSSWADLAERIYFGPAGGTVMMWLWCEEPQPDEDGAILTLKNEDGKTLTFDLRGDGNDNTNVVITVDNAVMKETLSSGGWHNIAFVSDAEGVLMAIDGELVLANTPRTEFHNVPLTGWLGAKNGGKGRAGVNIGELLFWNYPLTEEELASEMYKTHTLSRSGLTGCYSFVNGTDLNFSGDDYRTITEKILGIKYRAYNCLREENGPPARDAGIISADSDTTPKIYVQNDAELDAYNPNEEHAFVQNSGEGHVVWALRSDLNTADTSVPGVLVEYVKNGRKQMQWFDVAVTNRVYKELADDCYAGKALPGPHPLDLFDDPWRPETYWDEDNVTSPAHRDRKGQLWARAQGNLHVHMYYPMQSGFAFPSIATNLWPEIGTSVPWLALLDNHEADPIASTPAAWLWRVAWPEEVPEMEIGRTLTVAASGLPEVWNAKSVGVLWPATDSERNATAVLFDPTVAQSSGFPSTKYATVSAAVADLGIKQGAGGNATLRKGKWTFDGLPPSISSRFYIDTTASVTNCIKLIGEQEDNAGAVSLLHVNVLNEEERKALSSILDNTASDAGKAAWRTAIDALATARVEPSQHRMLSKSEDIVDYSPRDHYALFTMGATNYITIIENDSTNELMSVAQGDPIQMHVIKVVPKYYTGRIVTREDPLNLLSQQLSVIYAEAFAGSPENYVFEWRKCQPHSDGSVPDDFDGEYVQKFPVTAGLTRFVIGAQGDTLANMVNTYYAMRYRAANENAPSYASMGYEWSEWTDPPALAEGWVQRVLNNVTPFTQRMRDLYDNEAETAVTMIRQAGAPYEGDVALNQDNLTSVGLIQLYETILNKAESMSLQLGINDADANKQLQLAVARLADLYNVLGDEAYTDALNPTISFGSNFDTTEKTGFEMDYGALSSALFCFDNQVPTLLDEELALLRGRTGENAPSTHISPYYNRLVWNFTRGMNAGEVAYAVNYNISGNRSSVIDYSQAAEMYPQGHGDAYGHYLSALSGYYRLLRNPNFSWGEPAMGEMVVADSVLNVDYYDEAQFAKAAQNVAKVALETVDRTARKAYRDNSGATGAGYIDDDSSRNFGYGEWASRGGFGALCNWAVANSLLGEEPQSGKYYRYQFDADSDGVWAEIYNDTPQLETNGTWTIEFQVIPGDNASQRDGANIVTFYGGGSVFGIGLDEEQNLSAARANISEDEEAYTVCYLLFTNATAAAGITDATPYAEINVTNDNVIASCGFFGDNPPTEFTGNLTAEAIKNWADGEGVPSWDGWQCITTNSEGKVRAYSYTYSDSPAEILDEVDETIGQLSPGANYLVAVRCSGGKPVVTVFNGVGERVLEKTLPFDAGGRGDDVFVGGYFNGEIGEIRFWDDVCRTDEQLLAKREYVSPISNGLTFYLRTISTKKDAASFTDEVNSDVSWLIDGGYWIAEQESGMNIAFTDEGLKHIDRSTVTELTALADIVPQIQRKVDQMDAGLNPLGLASGAIPFDITPIGIDDGTATHFEQIRERAGVALNNARKALDKAQESANRMRLIQEAALAQEEMLSTAELEFKNQLIEYFGYPYEGDIGPGGSYAQGYDGPDIYHYAWMDPTLYGLSSVEDTLAVKTVTKEKPSIVNVFVPFLPSSKTTATSTLTFELSANGFVLKPSNITGKRRAQGKIQDALAEFICAYASLKGKLATYESRLSDFESAVTTTAYVTTPLAEAKYVATVAGIAMDYYSAGTKAAWSCSINALEVIKSQSDATKETLQDSIPSIQGAGMTVNVDPRALASSAIEAAYTPLLFASDQALLTAKNALAVINAGQKWTSLVKGSLTATGDMAMDRVSKYGELKSAWYTYMSARSEVNSAYRNLLATQATVETVVAEAERVIDERTLKRQQSVDTLTKQRYNEMLFRIERNNALTRYSSAFDLAQKYAYLAAQAYDYETGLLASDSVSGDKFRAEIVGARTLGEFSSDGEPVVTTGSGDGGLADILARLDANWLVLKPRLGINNPQPYATWFSLRHELYRIYSDARGDKSWKTALEKCKVDDLNALPEFQHYCQPLAGSTAGKEPGFVIEFPTEIIFGDNIFGNETTGGDSPLDPTWYATHIAAAGVHFVGYNDGELAKTPTCYLVPVGEDRMRAVGNADAVLSWKVVDQTIPVPYAIGSTELDDPDWTPLYNGATGGNDLGARIRKHPSFRAYYGSKGTSPSDSELDCKRLVGRSAWNTRWLLIIPAGAMNADRAAALDTFANGVSDIRIGFKTYSASGN